MQQLDWQREPQGLYAPIAYTLEAGGKRLRPTLALIACGMFGGREEDAVPAALALEVFHNFTLLHDDVMDNADVRRGKPTVHKKWNENTAILSGDNMLVLAFKWMQQCPSDKMPAVLGTFTDTAIEIDEGQQLDIDFEERDDVREEEYIEMIRLKTSVLLACAVKIGAIMADAPKEDAENIYKFGEAIGLSFQLQDDYLDVYGNPEVFGKAIGGDITSNKKTYMLINALNKAEGAEKKELEQWIGAKDFDRDEKVKAVTRIYNSLGIDKMAKAKMEQYYNDAIAFLDKINVPESRKQALRDYADSMMKREK